MHRQEEKKRNHKTTYIACKVQKCTESSHKLSPMTEKAAHIAVCVLH